MLKGYSIRLVPWAVTPDISTKMSSRNLSILRLKGRAYLLELLMNYSKVEIGYKPLDHFHTVATDTDITKLISLANIFHLLPSATNVFLESLVYAIVQAEAQMHYSDSSLFAPPLAKYPDHYPTEAVDLPQLMVPTLYGPNRDSYQFQISSLRQPVSCSPVPLTVRGLHYL